MTELHRETGLLATVLSCGLAPGVVLLDSTGAPSFADTHALSLLGCRDTSELGERWEGLVARLTEAGLPLPSSTSAPLTMPTPAAPCEIDLGAVPHGAGRLCVSLASLTIACDEPSAPGETAAALLVWDATLTAAVSGDICAASFMRSLAQIAPAVAHDLRAPINSMVLNLEVLKEALAAQQSARAMPEGGAFGERRDPRERQQRYLKVLSDELARLHKSLELFLSHLAPGGEIAETLDLRDPARDLGSLLAAPARKQLVRIEVLLPDEPVPVRSSRQLLRQALLHVGLAVLAAAPREGVVEIRLERTAEGAARLNMAAAWAGGSGRARQAGIAAADEAPRFSPAGTEVRLAVARGLLAACGAVGRSSGAALATPGNGDANAAESNGKAAPLPAGAATSFEIDFPQLQ